MTTTETPPQSVTNRVRRGQTPVNKTNPDGVLP